jgi:hypothetical protein
MEERSLNQRSHFLPVFDRIDCSQYFEAALQSQCKVPNTFDQTYLACPDKKDTYLEIPHHPFGMYE